MDFRRIAVRRLLYIEAKGCCRPTKTTPELSNHVELDSSI